MEGDQDRVYLDLTPVKSLLHCAGKMSCQSSPLSSPSLERAANKAAPESTAETAPMAKEAEPCAKATETSEQVLSKPRCQARLNTEPVPFPTADHPTSLLLSRNTQRSQSPRRLCHGCLLSKSRPSSRTLPCPMWPLRCQRAQFQQAAPSWCLHTDPRCHCQVSVLLRWPQGA